MEEKSLNYVKSTLGYPYNMCQSAFDTKKNQYGWGGVKGHPVLYNVMWPQKMHHSQTIL